MPFEVETVNGIRVSADITPDPRTGIGLWSDAQIMAALTYGMSADGSALSTVMPLPSLDAMKADDFAALVAWLRSISPIENAVMR